jgi:hypothetical protein
MLTSRRSFLGGVASLFLGGEENVLDQVPAEFAKGVGDSFLQAAFHDALFPKLAYAPAGDVFTLAHALETVAFLERHSASPSEDGHYTYYVHDREWVRRCLDG